MDTLLLTRSEVAQLLEPQRPLAVLREAFAAYSTGRSVDAMRIPMALPCCWRLGPSIHAYSVRSTPNSRAAIPLSVAFSYFMISQPARRSH